MNAVINDDGLTLQYFVTTLLRGAIQQATDPLAFSKALSMKAQISDALSGTLNLDFVIDEQEGYAYAKSRPDAEDSTGRRPKRLMERRALSFPTSMLLALLRKKLSEMDSNSSDTRLVVTRADMVEMLKVFLNETNNEVRLNELVSQNIKKIEAMGYLRALKEQTGAPAANLAYEVPRIIKAFVDAQWMSDFQAKLAAYHQYHKESAHTSPAQEEPAEAQEADPGESFGEEA